MAVLMTVAMPTWNHMLRREKEEELVFRGEQYARAIGAYQRRYANASPTSVDALIDQHYLRKKYKDPLAVTEDGEFALLYAGAQPTRAGGASVGSATVASSTNNGGGIIGVASKNPAESIRTYKDHTHY